MTELSSLRFSPDSTCVLCIDVQERLAAAMDPDTMEMVRRKARAVIEGAGLFGVPVIATEQYPKGLGSTVGEVREALPETPIEKTAFSCARVDAVTDRLAELGERTVVVLGMETHVCVWQTVRELRERGHNTAVLVDAVCSRSPLDRDVGLELCRKAGAHLISAEALLFDWVGDAKTENFKAISRLVK